MILFTQIVLNRMPKRQYNKLIMLFDRGLEHQCDSAPMLKRALR